MGIPPTPALLPICTRRKAVVLPARKPTGLWRPSNGGISIHTRRGNLYVRGARNLGVQVLVQKAKGNHCSIIPRESWKVLLQKSTVTWPRPLCQECTTKKIKYLRAKFDPNRLSCLIIIISLFFRTESIGLNRIETSVSCYLKIISVEAWLSTKHLNFHTFAFMI
jgi:hypothetical protein